jgi:glucokinase
MLLAGDIGGTKTDLAIYSPEAGARSPLAHARFSSAAYPDLETIVREFLAQVQMPVKHACFDVAGPVVGGRAKLTNLPWHLDETDLKESLNLSSVHLLNDLEALAFAIPHLGDSDLYTLNQGQPVANGALAVVAPGTGLGEAFLIWDGLRYRPFASEGGHANFAPANQQEQGLLDYLWKKYDHVSFERVCSGIGIPNIYDYLRDSNYAPEASEVADRIDKAEDRTKAIGESAFDPQNPSKLCRATIDMFVDILATECSNMTLKVLATGGLYIGGGIPAHVLPALQPERFMQTFSRKGRFSELLEKVPIHVITTSATTIGVASYGLEMAHL